MSKAYVFTDGGALGNPGEGAIGGVIYNQKREKIKEFSIPIGVSTNNQAEYIALIKALELATSHCRKTIRCFLDSELVVRQLSGRYRIKNEELRRLFYILKDRERAFDKVIYNHVKRSNKFIQYADRLVNDALDGR